MANQDSRMTTSEPPPAPPRATLLRVLLDLDAAVSLHIYTFFNPIIPFPLLKSLEFSGDGRLFFPIILSLLLTRTTTNLLLLNLLLGSFLDLLLIGLLKHLIQRPRPVYNKNMFLSFAVDHWSFPSGHSSRVSFIATLFYFYSDPVRQVLVALSKFDAEAVFVKYFVVIVGLWAAITSVSRVLLGRHFVLDVVIGACLGVAEGTFVVRVFNYEKLSSLFRLQRDTFRLIRMNLLFGVIQRLITFFITAFICAFSRQKSASTLNFHQTPLMKMSKSQLNLVLKHKILPNL